MSDSDTIIMEEKSADSTNIQESKDVAEAASLENTNDPASTAESAHLPDSMEPALPNAPPSPSGGPNFPHVLYQVSFYSVPYLIW